MLVEMDKSMLAALIRGCDPSYEIMDHPLIKSKGHYVGGHNDRWDWNYSFGDCIEEQLWETYQLLINPVPIKKKEDSYPGGPCSASELYKRLTKLEGVEYVYIEDHNNLSVTITVVGGKDEEIADILANSLAMLTRTLGDYQVVASGKMGWAFRIKREKPNETH